MGRAMLSKSLIQFSVDGQGCVLYLLFGLRPNYGRGNYGNSDLLQKDLCTRCILFSAPDPSAGHCRPTPPPEAPEHSNTDSMDAWRAAVHGFTKSQTQLTE